MKKKTRDIVVKETKYAWLVREEDFPQHTLKIWVSAEKTKPICELSFCILSEFSTITPKVVTTVIENISSTFIKENKVVQMPLKQVYETTKSKNT